MNVRPLFFYKGTQVLVDDTFRMDGKLVVSVTAREPIFRTAPRPGAPCKATPHGWVYATDLDVQIPLPHDASVAQAEVAR